MRLPEDAAGRMDYDLSGCAIFAQEKGALVVADVAERIRQERDRRDWTQQQLADATGIDRDKIGKIETGARKVSSTELVLISQAFQVPVQELLRPAAPVVMRRGNVSSREAEAAVERFNRYVEDSLLTLGLDRAVHGEH
jgi:transcriptional regulator with XRE-family HTH domain